MTLITQYEATILQFCRNKTRSTTQLYASLLKAGEKASYNYINRTLNDLVYAGLMRKRRIPKSKLVFYTTKPQGHRAAIDYWETEERVVKEKLARVKLMMNDNSLVNYCNP